eukprot:10346846-Heterocapsa_arctica.AAC.1
MAVAHAIAALLRLSRKALQAQMMTGLAAGSSSCIAIILIRADADDRREELMPRGDKPFCHEVGG